MHNKEHDSALFNNCLSAICSVETGIIGRILDACGLSDSVEQELVRIAQELDKERREIMRQIVEENRRAMRSTLKKKH